MPLYKNGLFYKDQHLCEKGGFAGASVYDLSSYAAPLSTSMDLRENRSLMSLWRQIFPDLELWNLKQIKQKLVSRFAHVGQKCFTLVCFICNYSFIKGLVYFLYASGRDYQEFWAREIKCKKQQGCQYKEEKEIRRCSHPFFVFIILMNSCCRSFPVLFFLYTPQQTGEVTVAPLYFECFQGNTLHAKFK